MKKESKMEIELELANIKIAKLLKDKERLDWLEKQVKCFNCTSDATDFIIIVAQSRKAEHGGPFDHKTLRAAIDAAKTTSNS